MVCEAFSRSPLAFFFELWQYVSNQFVQRSEIMRLKKYARRTFHFLVAVVLLCSTILPVFAATTFEVKYSTDIAVSEDDWWDRGVQYGRILVLNNQDDENNNVLLATHCELNAGLTDHAPGYPIYRSADNGKTWEIITRVTDTLTGTNSEWNPTLIELEKPCGDYPAGTVILAACSVDPEHSRESHIRLYFSLDGGYSFDQGVVVASAGGLDDGVWEPFLIQLDDGSLVCFYSDDSDPEYSQKIVYKQSNDAVNWGETVNVVASEVYEERPGMPVVTRLGDGSYFMVYEIVDKSGIDGNPVFCRYSKDGLDWGDPAFLGEEVATANGKYALGSAPYCAWTPVGGENGTLVVSGAHMRKGDSKTGTDLFISYDNGKTWKTVPHLIPYETADHVGYSNSFAFSKDGKTIYAINNPQRENNSDKSKMVVAVAELQETVFTQQNNTLIIIAIVGTIVLLGAITALVINLKKKKNL